MDRTYKIITISYETGTFVIIFAVIDVRSLEMIIKEVISNPI